MESSIQATEKKPIVLLLRQRRRRLAIGLHRYPGEHQELMWAFPILTSILRYHPQNDPFPADFYLKGNKWLNIGMLYIKLFVMTLSNHLL